MQIKFGKIKFTAAKSEKGCRFDACYKGEHVAFESEDMSLYDDVFSDFHNALMNLIVTNSLLFLQKYRNNQYITKVSCFFIKK